MSLTVIFADYLSGSISTSDALRRSGYGGIDELMVAVRAESDTRTSAQTHRRNPASASFQLVGSTK